MLRSLAGLAMSGLPVQIKATKHTRYYQCLVRTEYNLPRQWLESNAEAFSVCHVSSFEQPAKQPWAGLPLGCDGHMQHTETAESNTPRLVMQGTACRRPQVIDAPRGCLPHSDLAFDDTPPAPHTHTLAKKCTHATCTCGRHTCPATTLLHYAGNADSALLLYRQ